LPHTNINIEKMRIKIVPTVPYFSTYWIIREELDNFEIASSLFQDELEKLMI